MNRTEKGQEIQKLAGHLRGAKTVVFAWNQGLKVVKNRLAKKALKEIGIAGLDDFFKGPTTIASSETDPVSPAKILVAFAKDHEALKLRGGYFEGVVLTLERVKSLAALPSKEELLAKLLGCLQNPSRQLVTVLAAVPRQLVTVLDAIAKKKTV